METSGLGAFVRTRYWMFDDGVGGEYRELIILGIPDV
jgi:hypothetical protein